ncbi:MAG TPA: phage tail sheath C-terminal domain-containing protein [Mycobacteriales bacterium]|jgi:hypothetical protein
MATLVVPGVRVDAKFDVLPPQPAAAGVLGAVGIVDLVPPGDGLAGVTRLAELREIFGPGTPVTMPQVVHAFANGVREVVVSPVLGGRAARLTLNNRNGVPAVHLRARSAGAWANGGAEPSSGLRAEVRETTDAEGKALRVSLRLYLDGRQVESFADLRVAPGEPDDLVTTINTRSAYVVAVDPGVDGTLPAAKEETFDATKASPAITFRSAADKPLFDVVPAEGATANGLRVALTVTDNTIGIDVHQSGLQERHRGMTLDPDDDDYLPVVLATRSRLIRTRILSSLAPDAALPAAVTVPAAFAEGESPSVDAYRTAVDRLAEDTRIDLVLAAVEPRRAAADVRQIHQALLGHAVAMTDAGAPRIAFGSIAPDEKAVSAVRDHASVVRNRRFVLVSPAGAEGAVAGLVARLDQHESPTFKQVSLLDVAAARYRESELNQLLGPTVNALVVQDRRGRGVVVLKGIDTTGDQISVTRVADQAIRETKAIAENFIGELNSDTARVALKQQLIAMFTRLERAGAIVPSTDGEDPAFRVDVYSTQQDFAQGIVRIDIAVRPVRAIDYVYATIRVKN